jgi:20S proteasome alpha/beta subunit
MTLVVAIKAQDGIVLAGDSRGTIGDPRGLTAINDTQQKVHQLGNHGIAFAGSSETAAALLDENRKRALGSQTNVDELVNEIAKVSADLFVQWFREIRPAERAGVILLLAGYRFTPPIRRAGGRRRAINAPTAEPLIYCLTVRQILRLELLPKQ